MIISEASTRTIVDLADHMQRLRESAELLKREIAAERGFFSPSEDDQISALWVSYCKSRAALHELIGSVRDRVGKPSGEHVGEFALAYAAALILVNAARSLRVLFGNDPIVRRKLNESHPGYGIEINSFDAIQMSLTDPTNALRIRDANQFYEQNSELLCERAAEDPLLHHVVAVIDTLRAATDVSTTRYVKARVAERKRDARDRILVGSVVNAVYAIQEWGSRLVSHVKTIPNHIPRLPNEIQSELLPKLQPGDVLATRKDCALTNYFLPGYWPHVAMFVGAEQVVESLKDGVRERAMDSPFGNDAIAVIRPRLDSDLVKKAIKRARTHVGKPYDFDFDFTRADRMVCTEVVYRSYEGIGGFHFELVKRAGRQTLSAEDLLGLALTDRQFDIVGVYCAPCSEAFLTGEAARDVLVKTVDGCAD